MLFNCDSFLKGDLPIAISGYFVCRVAEPIVIIGGAATVALLAYACFAHEKIKSLQMTNVKRSCIQPCNCDSQASSHAQAAGMLLSGIALLGLAKVVIES